MNLSDALKNLGFTQQEAILYIKLSQSTGMTGYEAAKESGISRSNAYASLSNLVDKGYAYIIDGNPVHYLAVDKRDLITNAKRDFKKTIHVIEDKLITTPLANDPYITIMGEKAILDKMKNMIAGAEKRIYLSVDAKLLKSLEAELRSACDKQLKVVLLSSENLACSGHIFYASDRSSSIKLITDSEEVLAGTLGQSLYSKNLTLVNIIKESVTDEIELIAERRTS